MQRTHAFRLLPGQDLRAELLAYVTRESIGAAWIATAVGSLREVTLRFAGQTTGEALNGPFEILSLTGTLGMSGCHLHIALGDSRGQMIGGHLLNGSAIHSTAEIVLGVDDDFVFNREHDDGTGHRELGVSTNIEK